MTKPNVKTISYNHIVLLSVVLYEHSKFTQLGHNIGSSKPITPSSKDWTTWNNEG